MVCVFCMLPSVVREHLDVLRVSCATTFGHEKFWSKLISAWSLVSIARVCGSALMRMLMPTWDLCQVQKVISSPWNHLWADALDNRFFNASKQSIAQSLHLHSGERLNWLWWNFADLVKRHICQVLIKNICWDYLFSFRDDGSVAQVPSEHTIRSTFFVLPLKSRLLRPPSKVAS